MCWKTYTFIVCPMKINVLWFMEQEVTMLSPALCHSYYTEIHHSYPQLLVTGDTKPIFIFSQSPLFH